MILHTTEVIPLLHYRPFLRCNNDNADEADLSADDPEC